MPVDPKFAAAVRANARRAHLIAVGSVQSVGRSPAVWSGLMAAFQEVTYRAVTYLKVVPPWLPPGDPVHVFHPVVAGSWTADPATPRLRTDFFVPGAEMVLFLTNDPVGWVTADENSGVVAATADVRRLVADELGR